jgi:translation initiation factor 4A
LVCPSRELANAMYRVLESLSAYMEGVKCQMLVGGVDARSDTEVLRQGGVQIIVGTPGRICYFLQSQALQPGRLKMIVLDEADTLLDEHGYLGQVQDLFSKGIPPLTQVAIFSHAYPETIVEAANQLLKSPTTRILLRKEVSMDLTGSKNYLGSLDKEEWKLDTLCDIYETLGVTESIIFVNTVRRAEWLLNEMKNREFGVAAYHRGMERNDLERVAREFRTGAIRVLIATELCIRGVDVYHAPFVINYDMPDECETYVRRVCRTVHWGRIRSSISFVVTSDERDMSRLREIERQLHITIPELPADFENAI